jgi:hypothetical protein
LELVVGVDVDPQKSGKSLAEVCGIPSLGHAPVWRTVAELLEKTRPNIILHTASSSAERSLEQMRPALLQGVSVASTCEELVFPALKSAAVANEFDQLGQKHGARIVGVGVNPGFVMDLLPICLTGVSREVDSIYVERIVDASTRRQPLQAKSAADNRR